MSSCGRTIATGHLTTRMHQHDVRIGLLSSERCAYGTGLIYSPRSCARVPFRAVLCGMWVSVGNLSMIGVIYGSDGSVGLSWSHHEKLALGRQARRT